MHYLLSSVKSALERQLSDAPPSFPLLRFPFFAPKFESLKSRTTPSTLFDVTETSSNEHQEKVNSPQSTVVSESQPFEGKINADFQFSTTPKKAAILNVPADVLFLVSDELDVASVHALSLTCRSLYCVGFPKTQRKLKEDDQRQLLTLLERDQMGDGHYYCHKCNKLHTYEPSCGPSDVEETESLTCGTKDVFSPTGNPYGFGYHHARLVMNRHFFGPKHGIPIDNICVDQEAQRANVTISCKTSANIIRDELFVHRSYSFTVSNSGANEFRKCTGHRDFRLCEHLPFFRSSSVYQQGIPELQARPRASATEDQFLACHSAPGSCGLCLLDYDITIERVEGGEAWKVTINAFHQLGDCRTPDDWKWARFTERSRPHLFLPNRPNRRGSGYSPGSVRRTWMFGGDQGRLAHGQTAHLKRHSI